MTFEEFKSVYIDDLEGYLPTYITADDEHESDKMRVNVEMIAPFRMTDGPSKFFRVLTIDVTAEQYLELMVYAQNAGEKWKSDLMENVKNCLKYSRTKFDG